MLKGRSKRSVPPLFRSPKKAGTGQQPPHWEQFLPKTISSAGNKLTLRQLQKWVKYRVPPFTSFPKSISSVRKKKNESQQPTGNGSSAMSSDLRSCIHAVQHKARRFTGRSTTASSDRYRIGSNVWYARCKGKTSNYDTSMYFQRYFKWYRNGEDTYWSRQARRYRHTYISRLTIHTIVLITRRPVAIAQADYSNHLYPSLHFRHYGYTFWDEAKLFMLQAAACIVIEGEYGDLSELNCTETPR